MYDFKSVEKKWQDKWYSSDVFKAIDFSEKPKYYVLSEFFNASGKSIHIGHIKCFTPSDIMARYKRLKGFNVLYPMGTDEFGLPPENFAIKTGLSPKIAVQTSRDGIEKEVKAMGFSFDFSRKVETSDPSYYKWTQWIFLQLFSHGLAHKQKGVVNFCAHCKTVLSNEDSQGGLCDRCHNPVVQEFRDVWYLKMQSYAEKMLTAIDRIDMRENLKNSQKNWIGKSVGAEITFTTNVKENLVVFTTRPDTLFGATFMAICPDHSFIESNKNIIKNIKEIQDYITASKFKGELDKKINKEKTGIKLDGAYAINPVNSKKIPIFVADYVLSGYGTGAIMAVPAHDQRDYDFAKKYNIDIIQVISGGDITEKAFEENGTLINSEFLNGLDVTDAKNKMITFIETNKFGKQMINYVMQDWPFNRQRYWGEPFPVVICNNCGYVAMDKKDLPLILPELSDYKPNEKGDSPLSKATDWLNCTCPKCGGSAKRESDTMPNWAGSSWYWLRFMDPHNDNAFVSKENLNYWKDVDLYTGGVEHVTRHMLYASFWHNFLYDTLQVPYIDPFKKRMCNGLILADDGKKMSKSSANAVAPIEVIKKYGTDVFRMHIMFMGGYEDNIIWTYEGIEGCKRAIENIWNMQSLVTNEEKVTAKHEYLLNTFIKKVEEDINEFSFNTAIAEIMKFINEVKTDQYVSKKEFGEFLIAINPIIPHITSEIYEIVFNKNIAYENYPSYDVTKLVKNEIELPIQINGKIKGTILINNNATQEEVINACCTLKNIDKSTIKKVIYVPQRIINLIV
ncbi:MAG: leucine--tRNA ligase [Clostridia bacterium]|jgi:leucyl-tRNA synthetase|nr:leucine--tRNA ligase [Clostridia bacterium]MDD4275907.1 leucine--tRNA ligase [Clostridia bacterium]